MLLPIIPETRYWRFYLYLDVSEYGAYFCFPLRGDEILVPLSLVKWLKGKRFFSTSFCKWYSSLKAIQKEWEEYTNLCEGRRNDENNR